jgi:hypothetical protein
LIAGNSTIDCPSSKAGVALTPRYVEYVWGGGLNSRQLTTVVLYPFQNEFYFETVWLAYSLIEGRVDSALEKTVSGALPGRVLFGIKLNTLISRLAVDSNLMKMKTAYKYDDLLNRRKRTCKRDFE